MQVTKEPLQRGVKIWRKSSYKYVQYFKKILYVKNYKHSVGVGLNYTTKLYTRKFVLPASFSVGYINLRMEIIRVFKLFRKCVFGCYCCYQYMYLWKFKAIYFL